MAGGIHDADIEQYVTQKIARRSGSGIVGWKVEWGRLSSLQSER